MKLCQMTECHGKRMFIVGNYKYYPTIPHTMEKWFIINKHGAEEVWLPLMLEDFEEYYEDEYHYNPKHLFLEVAL